MYKTKRTYARMGMFRQMVRSLNWPHKIHLFRSSLTNTLYLLIPLSNLERIRFKVNLPTTKLQGAGGVSESCMLATEVVGS
jgi:hypothetical protein